MIEKLDYYTYETNRYGKISVHGWGTYPRHSVLAGQPMKVFQNAFDTVEEALHDYPQAAASHTFMQPQVSLAHLPGEDDPVPGGMYPDDIGGEDYVVRGTR